MQSDYLLVGSGVSAQAALEGIRWQAPQASITLVTDDALFLYNRPSLFAFLKGSLKEEQVMNRRPRPKGDRNLSIMQGRVKRFIPEQNKLVLTDDTPISYRKLLLATGGKPVVPPWPRAGAAGVYTVWTLAQAIELKEAMKRPGKAVVVGGGTLGMQLAEALQDNGFEVYYLVREGHLGYPVLEEDAARRAQEIFQRNGVSLLFGEEPSEVFASRGIIEGVITSKGRRLDCTIMAVAIGAKPDLSYLEGSGISTDGGILVNEYLQTNFPSVYAAGSAAEAQLSATGPRYQSCTAFSAALQGRVAGLNMAGREEPFIPGLDFSHLKVFGVDFILLGSRGGSEGGEELVKDQGLQGYQKLLLKDGIIVGAVLLKETSRFPWLKKMMELKLGVEEIKDRLLDDSFDLAHFCHNRAGLVTAAAGRNKTLLSIDLGRCVGCFACTVACDQENRLSPPRDLGASFPGSRWNQVFCIGPVGTFPQVRMHYLPTQCNHCLEPACLTVCLSGATYQLPGGQVLVDEDKCLGCLQCMFACPYGARYYDEKSLKVEKCNLCLSRVANGLLPACVATCPVKARDFDEGGLPERALRLHGYPFHLPSVEGLEGAPRLTYILPERWRQNER